ncbi:MAG: ATP-binding cassette domain-containing protein [Rubrivivax sp.]|nr:ATP-binding cassette domain-containing protein [Rubrivivax sp.]
MPGAARRRWAGPPRRRWSRGSCGWSWPPVARRLPVRCWRSEGGGVADSADVEQQAGEGGAEAATRAAGARAAGPHDAPERDPEGLVAVRALAIAAGNLVVQSGLTFDIRRGEVLVVMGPSGCGKSTLLRHLVGLERPLAGQVFYDGQDLHHGDVEALAALRRRFGVMFQAGALWSSMSLGENVMFPMRLFTRLGAAERRRRARFKLALVGLDGGFDLMPAQLSGGMRKRAALARALALEPELLYLDEPGSGLDPLNAARLDELVLNLRDHLGTAVVMVTHENASIMAVGDRALYLDPLAHTMTAYGAPRELLRNGPPEVRAFLQRGVVA